MSDTDAPLTVEEAAALTASFPPGYISKSHAALPFHEVISDYGPLDETHLAALTTHIDSGVPMGVKAPDLKAIRNTHHRLAQLLAGGMNETQAAKLCNYSTFRVVQLKADPAFAELMAYYKAGVDEEFADFVRTAADLSMDFLGLLQQQLDETPEKFTPQVALEAIKVLADRTGNAPTTKTLNVNVNANLGDRLRSARERANGLLLEGGT